MNAHRIPIQTPDHKSRIKFTFCAAKKITFSDVVHFLLSGFVTKQSCHIWAIENLQIMQELEILLLNSILWCEFCAVGERGQIFFENNQSG